MSGLRRIAKYPFTSGGLIFAIVLFAYSLYSLVSGAKYVQALDFVDATTPLTISALFVRGVYVQRNAPDLKIFSLCVINVLSFIYCFESIYKFLFFGWVVHPAELRDLLLQIATALTVLVGIQSGDFRFGSASGIFILLFILTMMFWIAIGYPQLLTFDFQFACFRSRPHLIQFM